MAKNPAVQETEGMQVQPLGQEDILEQDRATHSKYSWLENPTDRRAWQATFYKVS